MSDQSSVVPKRIFFVIGEASGDKLAASLAIALKEKYGDAVAFEGLAGEALGALGVKSVFDIEDIAVMGIGPVISRLPTIMSRLNTTVNAILRAKPDLVVLVDSPDFTHRVARRVRTKDPDIPIVGWVSPSVWAWRPGRAKKMAAFVDHLLVLLPFEVAAHKRLEGPPATYVGHPLVAELESLRPGLQDERPSLLDEQQATILVLPGSRSGEIVRHMPLLHNTLARTLERMKSQGLPSPKLLMPAVTKHAEKLCAQTKQWPFDVEVISNPDEKRAAFRGAHAAIAASGTVTLELALAGIPMVVLYKLDGLARRFRFLIKTWTIVLPNLVIGRPVVREYVDEYARAETMARALVALASKTPERAAQVEAFEELDGLMRGSDELQPAQRARAVVERFLFP